ncbi:DUF4412 domain-containing protein [Belliella sp. R4-6]|uniref:DUF4412 domain-containing protein n=1 Tax=Belliella alkalica TaxID=1730871 RepID=A0ABS9V919_9BACT|nr:DUF4412 domain-containing protein [Belliella alkalica]MCH7412465.1 DUF4412 domain-containing protein [Belliella alkalica]
MKNSIKNKIVLTSCCLFFLISQGESQIMKKLTDKLGQKAISESTESVKKKHEKNPFEEMFSGDGGMDLSGMLGGSSDYKAPESYSFDFQVTMRMSMEKGKPMTQIWKYNTKEGYLGMENGGVLIIYDIDSDVMVTIDPKGKSYTAMSTKLLGTISGNLEEEDEDSIPEMIKTNETKTILGYKATKYMMEDDQLKGEFWMAPEVPFDQSSMTKSINSFGKKPTPLPGKMQGFMMEMQAYDKKSKSTSNMEVIQLGAINEVIAMKQYKNGMAF